MNLNIPIDVILQRYSEEQILRAIVNSYKAIIENKHDIAVTIKSVQPEKKIVANTQEPVATADHPPCGSCGGTFFLRTGTCHVCQTCGTSQGCS